MLMRFPQTSALDKDRRDESVSPDQYSRPRKSKSARIDDTTPMAMAATDMVLRDEVSITQADLEKAEVGSAEVARVESGFSDEEPSSAADPYVRPRGLKSARIGGAATNFEITIPAAPVTFNVLIPGDVDPRDKKLDGSRLSATSGKTESMGITTVEPQAVPEKKMRRADGALSVENEANPVNEMAASSRPSSWEAMSHSQKRNWRKRNE